MKYRRPILAILAVSLLGITAHSRNQASAVADNPIGRENARPGNGGWYNGHLNKWWNDARVHGGTPSADKPAVETVVSRAAAPVQQVATLAAAAATPAGVPNTNVDNAGLAPVMGWADTQSVNKGGSFRLYISSKVPTYDLAIYRMGWYGGAGGRLIDSDPGLPGRDQGIPIPDPVTGLIETKWSSDYTINTRTTWESGFYLVQMTPTGGGISGYIPFVVRDDASTAQIVYQIPFTTYQAYNGWGGKSLYPFNSTDKVKATKVSFNRPYLAADGAGGYFDGDYTAIRFLEREGYNVTYVASSDVESNPGLMNNRKMFLSNFHDEYWSGQMRNNLASWVNQGKNVAFLAANNVYWQVRFEAASNGGANRTMVSYKSAALDPLASTNPSAATLQFRDPLINKPENGLLGSMYEGNFSFGQSVPWIVSNASHWLYAGTGLTNGSAINSLVGYEWDRVFDNGATPAGIVRLSNSPVTLTGAPVGAKQEATMYTASSGATVFNASTTYWPRMLDAAIGPESPAVQQMTRNLLNRLSGTTPVPTTTTVAATTTTVAATTTTRVPVTTTTVPVTTLPVTTTAAPVTSCTAGKWLAQYFKNTTLSGTPALVRCENAVNDNWGNGAPATGIPADYFSVRWTRKESFNGWSTYTYTAKSDDGIRVKVGSTWIINNWTVHAPTVNRGYIRPRAGTETVVVEYFENTGGAIAQLSRTP